MDLRCRVCSTAFQITPEAREGYATFGYEPISECFACQQMHKLSFRNGTSLYKRTCDATGKSIVSIYHKSSPFTVYDRDYWYSDQWDPLAYGQEIDFKRSFFDQFKELQRKVPRVALLNVNPENSDYCNMCLGNKDCYFVFGGDMNQNLLYSLMGMHNKSSVDCDFSNHNEVCHDLFHSFHCYGCRSVVDSKNCTDCSYISDCLGCSDCILCVNLVKKKYCIENEQLTKAEYEKRRKELVNGSYSAHTSALRKLRDMRSKRLVKFVHTISCENCTGDYMENSKNCRNVYFCSDSEDVTDGFYVADAKDSFRSSYFGHKSELDYNCMSCICCNRSSHCFFAIESSECEYCDTAINCSECFGCSSIRMKKYCILNKQYSKEEYRRLRERLVSHMKETGEWGEFFPKELSCFAYNESTGFGFYPLEKEAALSRGFSWYEGEEEHMDVEKVLPADQLPDSLQDIPDDILHWALRCERTNLLFRLTKQELAFYRNHSIPVPRFHPTVRSADRIDHYYNKPQLYERRCALCKASVISTYVPDCPEKVVCEECYLKEIY